MTLNTKRQIDPGTHEVRVIEGGMSQFAGVVYVEGTRNEFATEHWVLNDDWGAPTEERRLDVRRMPSAEQFESFSAFVEAMRERSANWRGLTYIRAECEYSTKLPSI